MLSCYTANLIGHLRRRDPGADGRFARAVDLSVRTDLPDGLVAFTHHRTFDAGLRTRCTDRWDDARDALREEFESVGDVIAVADTYRLPWSPSYGRRHAPHWVRLADRGVGRWLLVDGFDALLPEGRQHPHRSWVDDGQLRSLLAPLPQLPPAVALRDAYALGAPPAAPVPPGRYRWLEESPSRHAAPPDGTWVHGTVPALRWLSERLSADVEALRRHTEDLWAAGRHHQFRDAGDERAVAAWTDFSLGLRFAVDSADRGRPRPSLVTRAFDQVIAALPLGTGAAA